MKSAMAWWMVSLGAVCLWTQAARAQACAKDEDCVKGFTCQAYETSVCPTSPACERGKECPAPEPCTTETQHQCAPAACKTNADCADFMVCHTSTTTECPAVPATAACPPNQTCPPPEPVDAGSCKPVTSTQCVPRYELPCETAADCGDGFSCEAVEECTCSGTGASGDPGSAPSAVDAGAASGSGSSSSAFAPAPQDAGVEVVPEKAPRTMTTCECHPSTVKSCRLKELDCKTDTDCPSALICRTFGGGSASCMVSPDGGECVTVTSETFSIQRCEPRYYGSVGGVGKDGSTQATSGGLAPATPSGMGTSPVPARDGQQASDAGAAAESSGDAAPSSTSDGGCSVQGPGGESASGYALGLLLIALGLRRRRPR